MSTNIFYSFTAALCLFSTTACADNATPAFILETVPNASLCGSGTMRVMLWDIYDATLYAEPESCGDLNKSHALSLTYRRGFEGSSIAERSAKEIRNITDAGTVSKTTLSAWKDAMLGIFPNVKKGDTITGIYIPEKETIFVYNDDTIGTIKDPAFGKPFFSIWLAEDTSAPKLRHNLLNINE